MIDYKKLNEENVRTFAKLVTYQELIGIDVTSFLDIVMSKRIEHNDMSIGEMVLFERYLSLVKDLHNMGLIDLDERWLKYEIKFKEDK